MDNATGIPSSRPHVYVAGPLFNESERGLNRDIRDILARCFNVYLPQEDGGLMSEMVASGVRPSIAARRVFLGDTKAIEQSDILLLILDGRSVDEGAAFELGVASAQGKHCYGLQTDVRRLLPYGNNPMIDCALKHIFNSLTELERWVDEFNESGQDKWRDATMTWLSH